MRYLILALVCLLLASPVFAQETPAVPPSPTPAPVGPDAAALVEIQALVDEARTHAEDAGRYAGDASNFLGLFEALGLTVTVGGALFAALGVQRLFSAQNELRQTRKQFEDALQKKEAELELLKNELSQQAEKRLQAVETATANATLALALLPLGERQYRAQDYDGAIQTYQRALALDALNPITHLRIGYVYTQSGKLPEARIHLIRALEIEPDFPPALAALGYVYRRIGEKMSEGLERQEMLNQAEAMLIKALRLSPNLIDDDGESWWGSLGGLYRRRGQTAQAMAAYEEARKVTPYSSYPVSNLALLHMETQNLTQMMESYRRVERLARDETQAEVGNHWGYADLLTAQLVLDNMDEARQSLEAVIDLSPVDSPYVLNILVDTLQRLIKALNNPDATARIEPVIARLREVNAERIARQAAPRQVA
jgi:tetratricopeptide (TPR) repeat protein